MKISRFLGRVGAGLPKCRPLLLRLGLMGVALLCVSVSAVLAAEEEKKDKPPEPVAIQETTADGVTIRGTYFPGDKKQGKDTVPVILLHEQGGRGSDFGRLIEALWQKGKGYAVIVPDLRGHGASRIPGVNPEKLRPLDYQRMVSQDMEALHRFLLREHNAGHLNVDRLCIIGAGMGANVALYWTRLNWLKRPLAIGKQGQDVKGLVLVSPDPKLPGLPLAGAMQPSPPISIIFPAWVKHFKQPQPLDFRREVAVMILVGDDEREQESAEKLYNQFERARKLFPAMPVGEERDLYKGFFNTKLQGTRLLREPSFGLDQYIRTFLRRHLANRAVPHEERRVR